MSRWLTDPILTVEALLATEDEPRRATFSRSIRLEISKAGSRHLDLSRIGDRDAGYEVNHCVAALTHYLAPPTTYAYPAGRWNANTLALMRGAGIKAALTERPGVVTSLAAPYTLPRRRIDRDAGLASFAVLATP